MSTTRSAARADLISACATALGAGLLAFMVSWLIGARIAEMIWAAPTGPIVAMSAALTVGAIVAMLTVRRLLRVVRAEAQVAQSVPA